MSNRKLVEVVPLRLLNPIRFLIENTRKFAVAKQERFEA
jgi:hypothetical protein